MKLLSRRQQRYWLIAAGLLILAVIVWLLIPREEAPKLATSPVVKGYIEDTVVAVGTIKPSKLVSVGAQVSGRIESLKVDLGDKVKAGDLIAEIDSRNQINALQSAQSSLENAMAQREVQKANLRQYELAFERQQKMYPAKASSQADYESAKASVEATKAQIRALDATIAGQKNAVATAQTNLDYTKISAPIDGTVLAVVSKQGQTVNANQSAPTIVMLGDLNTMTVYSEISEADVVRAKEGQDVYFTILGNTRKRYESKLRKIEPAPASITSEDSTGSQSSSSSTSSSAIYYNGLFDIDNAANELRTYMTAEVNIVLAKAEDALIIPAAALGRVGRGGEATVQVIGKNGKPEERKIKVGINNKVNVEVLSGLEEGEEVVVGQAVEGQATIRASNQRQTRGPAGPAGGPGGPRMMGF